MPVTHKNRLQTTISAVGSAGLGAFTISTASSGYRTFAAGDDGKTFDVLITEGTTWEVRTACAYTHSGTSLARGTLEDSSTGSAITFTSAAIVTVVGSAGFGNNAENTFQSIIPGGRLTLESGVPVSTTDQTAKTNIYYTPYINNIVNLWDGNEWVPTIFSETTEALGTLTSGLPYDILGFLNSGVLDLEKLAWTNDTTRATAITLQDGRYCKSGDKTRLYLGTFYTTSTTTTEDSAGGTTTKVGGKRYLFNMYNRVPRDLYMRDTGADWVYKTAAWRVANGATAPTCCVQFMLGMPSSILADYRQTTALSNTTGRAMCGVGLDNSTPIGIQQGGYADLSANYVISALGAQYGATIAEGKHYVAALEYGAPGTDCQFSGGATGQTGLHTKVNM